MNSDRCTFSVSDTGILGKGKSEFSQQQSNLKPSNYKFECSSTKVQKTRGSKAILFPNMSTLIRMIRHNLRSYDIPPGFKPFTKEEKQRTSFNVSSVCKASRTAASQLKLEFSVSFSFSQSNPIGPG